MKHPFDGIVAGESQQQAGAEPTRRGALGTMAFATAGLLGLASRSQGQIAVTDALNEQGKGPALQPTTLAIGEEGAAATTRALGEEGAATVTTEPFGEEAGRVMSRTTPGLEDGGLRPQPTTRALREEGAGRLTRARNEEGVKVTTQAVGEEGGKLTTQAIGEEGARATTQAIGEEGGRPVLTQALNENGAALPGRPVLVPPAANKLSDEQMEQAWKDLADTDVGKALQASAILYGAQGGTAFLRKHLKLELPQADPARIALLIRQLDADAFEVRENAEKQLAAIGTPALAALQKASREGSVEVRMRTARVLEGMKDDPRLAQVRRGVEVLVALRTPEARTILETLAKGPQASPLTEMAVSALERMPR